MCRCADVSCVRVYQGVHVRSFFVMIHECTWTCILWCITIAKRNNDTRNPTSRIIQNEMNNRGISFDHRRAEYIKHSAANIVVSNVGKIRHRWGGVSGHPEDESMCVCV